MKIFYLVLNIINAAVSIIGKVAKSTKRLVTREEVEKEADAIDKMKDDLKKSKYWKE
jgi:hypothetical protein